MVWVIENMCFIIDCVLQMMEIILLIDGIVFQINILVFNVVVEVVWVGDYGKGFFVVVGEVCNLVYCSVEVVKNIKVLIDVMYDNVWQGVVIVQEVEKNMQEIVGGFG